jgi:dihydroorotase
MRFDLVINGARVLDPEADDIVRADIGIRDGRVAAVSSATLVGDAALDARGMLVTPGFIDMHCHAQDHDGYVLRARDGVTTALELEAGPADVDGWYAERAGGTFVNHGASVGHMASRIVATAGTAASVGPDVPKGVSASGRLSVAEVQTLRETVRRGLTHGALAVGMGLAYNPGASFAEVTAVMKAAAEVGAAVHVHVRRTGSRGETTAVDGVVEMVAGATISGAKVCICHVSATAAERTVEVLDIIADARAAGLDMIAESHPYTAGMAPIDVEVLDTGFQDRLGIDYGDIEMVATHERLSAETWADARRRGGFTILHGVTTPEAVSAAISRPWVAVASDALSGPGRGHPRAIGTNTRVLGRHVRAGDVELVHAVRSMTSVPAQWLADRVPELADRARIAQGSIADLVVLDPETVGDRATFAEPEVGPSGIRAVLVNGTPVVVDDVPRSEVRAGTAVRAAH